MSIKKLKIDRGCSKCGFPLMQMQREYFNKPHQFSTLEGKKLCKIDGEHLHFECPCGHIFVTRPLDWKEKLK